MSDAGTGRTARRGRPAVGEDLARLLRLVETVPNRTRDAQAGRPPSASLPGADGRTAAEHRLRAIGALLVELQTTLERRSRVRRAADQMTPEVAGEPRPHAAAVDNGAEGPGTELAVAAARYIARDLAARRLSAFTSAEGYRLARTLAGIGGVEAEVEQLLVEANTVTLHPAPLGDTVSHSAV